MTTQKIQTTFGIVTIFKKSDENTKEYNVKEVKEPQQLNDDTKVPSVDENQNENFFGLKCSNEVKDIKPESLNYIEEQLLGGYDPEFKSPSTSVKTNICIEESDLNFVDKYYFSKNNATSNEEKLSKAIDITKAQIENTADLNFIDKVTFQAGNKTDDESIGSVTSFKKIERKTQSKESIPLIVSKNIVDNEESNANKFKNLHINAEASSKKSNKNTNFHKTLDSEVPKWYNLTIDDAAKILKNHICYMNQEEGLLAIDKPYGLPSTGGEKVHLSVAKLLPALQELLKMNSPLFMAHRLDENTTGVMLFATEKGTAKKLQSLFAERKVIKQYLAITRNVPKISEGEIDIPLIRRKVNDIEKTYLSPEYNEFTNEILDKPSRNDERKKSITKYRVLDSANQAALVELQPLTGFQHQIRAHLAYGLNCPILGDHKYSHNVKIAPQKLPDEMLKRLNIRQTKVRYVPMHLHAYRLILPEFSKASNVFITAKLPLHFLNNLKRLKLKF